jgi:2-C-methyl-D-erythritol 4-phosphate cytidylyltransferase
MGGIDKVFALIDGEPLLAKTVGAFEACPAIDDVVVVVARQSLAQGRKVAKDYAWRKVVAVCPGGPRRQDSVKAGLSRLTGCAWVVIHDGARPCIEPSLIERGLVAARESGAAVAGVPVRDTIKIVSRRRLVQQTPARQNLWAAQTPQVFRYDLIAEAYGQIDADVTDDASLVEQLGHRVEVYMGSYQNIKVTTPDDLAIANCFLQSDGKRLLTSGDPCASVSATMPTP